MNIPFELSRTYLLLAVLSGGVGVSQAAGLHIGWCLGAGNKHVNVACTGLPQGGSGPQSVPDVNQPPTTVSGPISLPTPQVVMVPTDPGSVLLEMQSPQTPQQATPNTQTTLQPVLRPRPLVPPQMPTVVEGPGKQIIGGPPVLVTVPGRPESSSNPARPPVVVPSGVTTSVLQVQPSIPPLRQPPGQPPVAQPPAREPSPQVVLQPPPLQAPSLPPQVVAPPLREPSPQVALQPPPLQAPNLPSQVVVPPLREPSPQVTLQPPPLQAPNLPPQVVVPPVREPTPEQLLVDPPLKAPLLVTLGPGKQDVTVNPALPPQLVPPGRTTTLQALRPPQDRAPSTVPLLQPPPNKDVPRPPVQAVLPDVPGGAVKPPHSGQPQVSELPKEPQGGPGQRPGALWVVALPGRQRPHDLPTRIQPGMSEAVVQCLVSGFGWRRAANSDGSGTLIGVHSQLRTTDILVRDIPANRHTNAGCVVEVQRRWTLGGLNPTRVRDPQSN